jgi:hypothetical protein
MNNTALQAVFRSTEVAMLLYTLVDAFLTFCAIASNATIVCRTYQHSSSNATPWTKNCLIQYLLTRTTCFQIYILYLQYNLRPTPSRPPTT